MLVSDWDAHSDPLFTEVGDVLLWIVCHISYRNAVYCMYSLILRMQSSRKPYVAWATAIDQDALQAFIRAFDDERNHACIPVHAQVIADKAKEALGWDKSARTMRRLLHMPGISYIQEQPRKPMANNESIVLSVSPTLKKAGQHERKRVSQEARGLSRRINLQYQLQCRKTWVPSRKIRYKRSGNGPRLAYIYYIFPCKN